MSIFSIKLGCLLLAILMIAAIAEAKVKVQKSIQFELKRNVVGAWTKKNSNNVNNFCFKPKESRPKRPLIFNTHLPSDCSEARIARISQECVFKNLAYNAKFYYDSVSNSTVTTSEKDVKKLEKSNDFLELAVDLSSPWSWVKSPVCQTCDRSGKNCVQNQCKYNVNSTTASQSLKFEKSYSCANCKIIEKCGEIDLYAEGMTVVGQFITPEKLRFKDSLQTLIKPKLLWAHALSGQEFLMADGMLGLGIEFNQNAQTLVNFNSTSAVKTNQNKDTFREDDADKDEYENEDDEEEEDGDKDEDDEDEYIQQPNKNKNNNNSKNNNKGGNDVPQQPQKGREYDFFEPEMNIVSPISSQFKAIKSKQFSLYIAEDDSQKYQLIIGEPMTQYIYKPAENPILWVQSLVNADLVHQYSLWVVQVQNIRIAKYSEEQKQKKNKQNTSIETQTGDQSEGLLPLNSISIDNPASILSISTTAIVLPEKDLITILQVLENEFGVKCTISQEYLFFVVCDDITSPKEELSDMTMIIEIGNHATVHLQVNPADLILDCKKKTKAQNSKYKCQMNLQQSYDNKIILGEAALRNQYIVFDQKENAIGFAPAKNKFNSASFIRRIGHLFTNIEQVIEEDITYIVGFLTLIILSAVAFIFFRHGKTMIALLQGKRVIVVDDKNDRMQLAQHAHETMDESAINELQYMQQQMEDSGIQNNDFNAPEASHPNDTLKPIDLEDL